MATKKAAKKKAKSKRVTSKTPARAKAKAAKPRTPSKPKNPKPSEPPVMSEAALKRASAPVKAAVAGKVAPPPHAPADLKAGFASAIEEAAIELLRRTCAKGQMVVGDKVQPLVNWLTRAGFATTQRQGATSRLYPTTKGRQYIRAHKA